MTALTAVSLTIGPHAFSSRFFYIPAIPLACAIVFLVTALWKRAYEGDCVKVTKSRGNTTTGLAANVLLGALLGAAANKQTFWNTTDTFLIWLLLFATVSTSMLLWRMKLIPLHLFLSSIMIAVGSQTAIYISTDLDGLYQAITTVICVGMMGKADWWGAALLVFLAWPAPHIVMPVVISSVVFMRCYSRWPQMRLAPSLPGN
jgi:hypothetical protein